MSPTSTSTTSVNPPMDEFRAGVTACLRSWSALRAAVEGGWGGHDSLAKAEDLRRNIFQHLDGTSCPPRSITVDDLEDNLAIYLEEEFSVVLEDRSEQQVADAIWRMYEQCMKGDFSLARHMVEASSAAIQQSSSYPVKVQSQNEDDDDDDDDNQDMEMDDSDGDHAGMEEGVAPPLITLASPGIINAQEYAAQNLFGPPKPVRSVVHDKPVRQLGEAAAPEPVVEVDDDGFAPVVKRKGHKK